MSKTLLEQAIADANSITLAAEETAKKKLMESLAPEIKSLVNRKLLMEEDDKSAEKVIDDEPETSGDTLAPQPSPEQMSTPPAPVPATSAPVVSEPLPEPVTSEPLPVSEPVTSEPVIDAPVSEPVGDSLPAEMPVDSAPANMDVPQSDFDDELIIELKPIIDADGGIEDLPVEGSTEPVAEPTTEVPVEPETSLKEAFMKRKSIKEALNDIPELKDSEEGMVSEEFNINDIPEDDEINEDVNLTLNFSDSDSSEEEIPEFLMDQSEEGESKKMKKMTEEMFVEEARKLYREKAKKAAKKSIKEFYKPAEVGFKYGKADVDPEKDSHLFPSKKDVAFEKVLPPEVKKWIVEAHKALNIQEKKINEQALLNYQLRLLVQGLTEHKISDVNFTKLVEALDVVKSIKESKNTFEKVIKESFDEEPVEMTQKEEPEKASLNEADQKQRMYFKRIAGLN